MAGKQQEPKGRRDTQKHTLKGIKTFTGRGGQRRGRRADRYGSGEKKLGNSGMEFLLNLLLCTLWEMKPGGH